MKLYNLLVESYKVSAKIVIACIFTCFLFANTFSQSELIKPISQDTITFFSYSCGAQIKNCLVVFSGNRYTASVDTQKFNLEIDYLDKHLLGFLKRVNSNCLDENDILIYKIRQKINTHYQKSNRKQDIAIIDSLTAELDKEVIGGELKSLSDTIPVYHNIDSACFRVGKLRNTYIIISKIQVQIDYNRISDINVSGILFYDTLKKYTNVFETRLNLITQKFYITNNRKDTSNNKFISITKSLDSLKNIIASTQKILGLNTDLSVALKTDSTSIDAAIKAIKKDIGLIIKSNKMIEVPIAINNPQFSLSFSGLNQGQFTLKLPVVEMHSLYINFGDILQYQSHNSEFTSIVKNQKYVIKPKTFVKVLKRGLSDYMSFRTFLDPLGFLGKNPNGFVQLEGHAAMPLGFKNRKRSNFLPEANFTFSYIYSNSITSEPRIAPTYFLRNSNSEKDGKMLGDTISRFTNNLDLVKYSYYQFNARFSIYALEMKKFNSWLHFESGIKVTGAKVGTDTTVNYMRNDTIIGSQRFNSRIMHKLIPNAQIRLEIRPDYFIGANICMGIAYLGNTPMGNNSPSNNTDISFLYQNAWALPHEVNVYAKTNSGGKGGLFFRYTGWWAFNKNLSEFVNRDPLSDNNQINKSSYFPQILVGYSTNLSTIIKGVGK